MEIAAYASSIANVARRAFGAAEAASALRDPAGVNAADVVEKYNPHDMSRREAFAMMKELEQNGLLPPGRSALDMTALHRPGESVWNVDMDAKFDVVEAGAFEPCLRVAHGIRRRGHGRLREGPIRRVERRRGAVPPARDSGLVRGPSKRPRLGVDLRSIPNALRCPFRLCLCMCVLLDFGIRSRTVPGP